MSQYKHEVRAGPRLPGGGFVTNIGSRREAPQHRRVRIDPVARTRDDPAATRPARRAVVPPRSPGRGRVRSGPSLGRMGICARFSPRPRTRRSTIVPCAGSAWSERITDDRILLRLQYQACLATASTAVESVLRSLPNWSCGIQTRGLCMRNLSPCGGQMPHSTGTIRALP